MLDDTNFDVIIIGGSYAGLSAAMSLGRSFRRVLIIDAGKPCNAQTPHSHNFLTQDGSTPRDIARLAKSQVLQYPTITFLEDFARQAMYSGGEFRITTSGGGRFAAKKLLLSTGIQDLFPPIKGFKESWGISVLHCPYCHGYEVAGRTLGVLGNGDAGYEMVKMIQHWSKNLTLFTNGKPTLTEAQKTVIATLGVSVVETAIDAFEEEKGYIKQIVFQDGTGAPLDAVFARVPFEHSSDIARQLGCDFTEANYIRTDDFGKTTVDHVFAAGDCISMFRAVSVAVAGGSKTGAFINRELIEEAVAAL